MKMLEQYPVPLRLLSGMGCCVVRSAASTSDDCIHSMSGRSHARYLLTKRRATIRIASAPEHRFESENRTTPPQHHRAFPPGKRCLARDSPTAVTTHECRASDRVDAKCDRQRRC